MADSAALEQQNRTLRRMKRRALGLLALTLAGFITSHLMGGQGGWAWLRAFCEAATVGALADWFAVVALFRHPLGVPLPHTAIIPNKKERIGDSLAVFVRDHFLAPETLLEKLKLFDLAARLGAWLAEPAQRERLGAGLRQTALQGLDLLDDKAVKAALTDSLRGYLLRWNAAGTASEILNLLTRDGRHQVLLDEALRQLGGYIGDEAVKQRISAMMVRYASREWPTLLKVVGAVTSVDELSGRLADRLARALLEEMQAVLEEPGHPLRRDYEAWVADYVRRLGSDPALAEQVDAMKQRLLAHGQVQAYIDGVWADIMALLRADLAAPDSAIGRHLEKALAGFGERLRDDDSLRDALNEHILSNAAKLADRLRDGVTEHISRTVRNWDERQLVQELERSVGSDLQYIRFSGTLVGGLIGLALHALVLLMAA